jgi:hypothetical protein
MEIPPSPEIVSLLGPMEISPVVSHGETSTAQKRARGRIVLCYLLLVVLLACGVLLRGHYFLTQAASLVDESESSAKENPSKSKTVPVDADAAALKLQMEEDEAALKRQKEEAAVTLKKKQDEDAEAAALKL